MTCNWYAVYTKPQKEKKVASILSKKGIENFCPIIKVSGGSNKSQHSKPVFEVLFNSYVFVYVAEKDIPFLKTIPGVINVVYWKAKPAIINGDELDLVKQLTKSYANIRLEKSIVDTNSSAKIIDEPLIAYKENSISVKYKSVKVNLPSLGYTMIAERTNENEKIIFEQPGLLASFPRRINALFFN